MAIAIMQALVNEIAVAPSVWPFEVSYVLLKKVRQPDSRLTPRDAETALNDLFQLPVGIRNNDYRGLILTELWPLARTARLSLFDASFLHLAGTYQIPPTSFDKALRSAALAAGIALLPESL